MLYHMLALPERSPEADRPRVARPPASPSSGAAATRKRARGCRRRLSFPLPQVAYIVGVEKPPVFTEALVQELHGYPHLRR